jgi:hypothetical protein
MVERFLRWRLPENFNPDGGISFKPMFNEHTAHPMKAEPVGTNLFDFTQAEGMIRYMVEGMEPALLEIPTAKRATGRTIPDLTKREHVCEYQSNVKAAVTAQSVGTCRTPHFLGEPTPDRKALTQTPHYELPDGLCKEWRPVEAAPVTGTDVAQQMPTQFLMSQSWAHSRGLGYRYSMSGQDLVDLLTDYTALIRTVLEEQTRDLREMHEATRDAQARCIADLRERAESETRQLREALAPIVERLKNWQLEKQYERDALHQFALELESVLAGGKPS